MIGPVVLEWPTAMVDRVAQKYSGFPSTGTHGAADDDTSTRETSTQTCTIQREVYDEHDRSKTYIYRVDPVKTCDV